MQKDCSISASYPAQFGRTIDLLGEDGFKALQDAFVVVIGLGGVGCHAAVSLVRSGIGRIRVIDTDIVTESSLNRHVFATREDVGRSKAEIMLEHLKKINPDCQIEGIREFFHTDKVEQLLDGNPDYIVDAIDSLNPKVALLKHAVENNLRVVSSMGASGHVDPTCIEIADISETRICPLARMVRRRLHKRGITTGIKTVFSTERPAPTLPPDKNDDPEWRGRERNRLSSLGVVPGIFGYTLSSVVITGISGYTKPDM